ncbi:MAG: hypothetical protein C4520_19880 [Candidatus Abyssobacteria bacterium SURF_5]|uniref:Uncharacterized protein n=1 Tax=Abyssobacteria bacterium (strain SURF_5) TaxID=2093360 RepID=A0A3A4NAG8_ABYX5|nr:MAG: hypothetical protein C4520_19880 [Candidatus Abyssubacteria bacterium SURF_5]
MGKPRAGHQQWKQVDYGSGISFDEMMKEPFPADRLFPLWESHPMKSCDDMFDWNLTWKKCDFETKAAVVVKRSLKKSSS